MYYILWQSLKLLPLKKEQQFLDVGTGGGFPGIPLAIMFPDVHFI